MFSCMKSFQHILGNDFQDACSRLASGALRVRVLNSLELDIISGWQVWFAPRYHCFTDFDNNYTFQYVEKALV